MTQSAQDAKPWDDVPCETVRYGAWDKGIRTIYSTAIPLWEELIESGHPLLGHIDGPYYTAFPRELPESLPHGAKDMGTDQGASRPYHWVDFGGNAEAAFAFAMGD